MGYAAGQHGGTIKSKSTQPRSTTTSPTLYRPSIYFVGLDTERQEISEPLLSQPSWSSYDGEDAAQEKKVVEVIRIGFLGFCSKRGTNYTYIRGVPEVPSRGIPIDAMGV